MKNAALTTLCLLLLTEVAFAQPKNDTGGLSTIIVVVVVLVLVGVGYYLFTRQKKS